MDSKRQAEVFRAFVKKVLRGKGLSFDKNMTNRNIGREVKEFNETDKLSTPLTVEEFQELYLDIMKELVAEHFALIEKKIEEAKKPEKAKPRRTVPGGVPGQAFYPEHSGQSGMSTDITE